MVYLSVFTNIVLFSASSNQLSYFFPQWFTPKILSFDWIQAQKKLVPGSIGWIGNTANRLFSTSTIHPFNLADEL